LSSITTHILDTSLGKPAANVGVTLEQVDAYGATQVIGQSRTDQDGRARDLLAEGVALEAGRYRLTFDVGAYFTATRRETFYPDVVITFDVRDANQHYHVPLLVSPFGYSTYRGS
jgi:5-hydroxyisourate hydrolase